MDSFDIAIIGGGIIGLASANALMSKDNPRIVVLEAEDQLSRHQSGHNSGVIHSGLYYEPGSQKAQNCLEGREALYRFCRYAGIPHQRCGKIVVATRPQDMHTLDRLYERGLENGLTRIKRLGARQIREYEAHVCGMGGLFIPDTGVVCFRRVALALADAVRQAGGSILTGCRFFRARRESHHLKLVTSRGILRCRQLINCAGLQSDRVARMCGLKPPVKIIPFRGAYYSCRGTSAKLIKHLVYPVPDPALPFLGMHFTRTIHGTVEAGPSAILSLERGGYSGAALSLKDTVDTLTYSGFGHLAIKHWRIGLHELHLSLHKAAVVRTLQQLVPSLRSKDLLRAGSGVRAQAVTPNGRLVDDWVIIHKQRMIHVLNTPSPAATASLAIGQRIAEISRRDTM